MSLTTATTSLLIIGPKCWTAGPGRLYARSNLFVQILTLFCFWKQVYVNGQTQEVHIQGRRFWLWFWEKRIPFADIMRIKYEYKGFATSWNMFNGQDHDSFDRYTVGLELPDGRTQHLFSWMGDGSYETGWQGVFMGDDIIDWSGTQDLDSRNYITTLKEVTGKNLT